MSIVTSASAFAQVRAASPTNKQGYPVDLSNTQLLCIYFSANWCPPCRQFTPMLNQAYNAWKANDEPIEIVFMSSCQTPQDTDEYYGHMDFCRIAHDHPVKGELSQYFGVSGIPCLAVVDHTGKVISQNATGDVYGGPGAINGWKQQSEPLMSGGAYDGLSQQGFNHGAQPVGAVQGQGPINGWNSQDHINQQGLKFKSINGKPIKVTFKNSTDRPLEFQWYGYDGALTSYSTMQPGRGVIQGTYAGHPWGVFTDGQQVGVWNDETVAENSRVWVEIFNQDGGLFSCKQE